MPFMTSSRVLARGEADQVFSIIRDVKRWPGIFPPCKKIEIVEEHPDRTRFHVTAVTRGVTRRWLSEQVVVEPGRRIRFRQLQPAAPFTSMEGEWIVTQKDGDVEIIMTHRFDLVTFKPLRFLIGAIIRRFFVDRNTDMELAAVVRQLEERTV